MVLVRLIRLRIVLLRLRVVVLMRFLVRFRRILCMSGRLMLLIMRILRCFIIMRDAVLVVRRMRVVGLICSCLRRVVCRSSGRCW